MTALVAETHGEAVRMIASLVGQHFEGGNQAARVLQREKKISPATSRRLDCCLATTYPIVQQIDVVMCRDFLRDLELQLRVGPQNLGFSEEAHENVQEQVVDSLPPFEESSTPVCNQVLREQIVAGERRPRTQLKTQLCKNRRSYRNVQSSSLWSGYTNKLWT